MQTDAAFLANNSQHCWMLHVASVCTPFSMLLRVVGNCCPKFETGQIFEPSTSKMSFVPWSLKVGAWLGQQCWIRLHSSSNIVRATHVHYTWFPKSNKLYPSHDALQVPTLLLPITRTFKGNRKKLELSGAKQIPLEYTSERNVTKHSLNRACA